MKKMSHISSKKMAHQTVRKTPFVPAQPKTNDLEPQDANPPSAPAQAMRNPMQPPMPQVGDGPMQRLKTGGKVTTSNPVIIHKDEKVDKGVEPEVTSRTETPAQFEARTAKDNPRLKFDGSNEDTFTKINKTRIVKLPKGSLVTPAPATSSSISPRGIAQRDQKIRFDF